MRLGPSRFAVISGLRGIFYGVVNVCENPGIVIRLTLEAKVVRETGDKQCIAMKD